MRGRASRLLAASLALLLCGCLSMDEEARRAVSSLGMGNDAPALAWSAELADESVYSKNLGAVEAGRVNMLAGRYAESERRFRAAVDSAVDRSETSPRIKLGDVGNTVMASTVTDDRTREYYLPPYELNLALEYGIVAQALNGRPDEALVDARLAVYVQDTLAETRGADLAKEPEGANDSTRKIVGEQDERLSEMIAATRNSWENPALWWLTGVLFEADGQLEMAWQSYRKAAAIRPDNAVFAADAARAGKGATPATGRAKLVVVYDQGFVPQRTALKIPLPVYTGFAIDLPTYIGSPFVHDSVTVAAPAGPSQAAPAVDVYSLAARDLKEQMPGIVVRNVTRAAVQAGTQAAVNAAGNDMAKALMFLANAVVSTLRSADTRSWVTLPAAQQVWRDGSMAPGVYDVSLSVGGRPVPARVPLAAGETRLLWVASAGSTVRGASATLGGAGVPPSDLNGNPIVKEQTKETAEQ